MQYSQVFAWGAVPPHPGPLPPSTGGEGGMQAPVTCEQNNFGFCGFHKFNASIPCHSLIFHKGPRCWRLARVSGASRLTSRISPRNCSTWRRSASKAWATSAGSGEVAALPARRASRSSKWPSNSARMACQRRREQDGDEHVENDHHHDHDDERQEQVAPIENGAPSWCIAKASETPMPPQANSGTQSARKMMVRLEKASRAAGLGPAMLDLAEILRSSPGHCGCASRVWRLPSVASLR